MRVVNDTKFNTWKREVDKLCVAHFGLSTDDLPDANWRDYHEDEMSPGEIFPLLYQILISKEKGPKLAGFIRTIGKERVLKLLPS